MTEPTVVQKKPFVVDETPGRKAWCAYGRSSKQPYCDGSHKGTGLMPIITEIGEAKKVFWCGCKHSGTKPFCDGTHRKL